MNKLLLLVTSSVSVFACGKLAPDVTIGDPSDPRFQSVLAYTERDMGRYGVPGGAIAIVEHGKLAFAAGLGVRARGSTELVSPATLFRVASMSKMVLAATALELVSEDPDLPDGTGRDGRVVRARHESAALVSAWAGVGLQQPGLLDRGMDHRERHRPAVRGRGRSACLRARA